jgi:predicted TIM-barrel fold metal-dependent hydrolase
MREVASHQVSRRGLLSAAAAAALAGSARAAAASGIPIVDSHIHLFDPNRPQGAPYSGPPNSPTHKTGSFPSIYAKLARPLGIVGAIEIEASPWVEDNLWVLEQAAASDIIVGKVGNLNPEAADFGELLERFHKNPLFRGIRYGNIWGYDLAARSRDRTFLERLKLLAQADLSLDTANQNLALLEAALRVSDAVPDLRIVIDHLPAFEPTASELAAYRSALRDIGGRPQIFTKLSEVIHPVGGKTRTDLPACKARLDHIYESFGEDRVLFGSDWPNSDGVAPIGTVLKVVEGYFASKSRAAQEKYFWANSARAYKWVRRSPAQPKHG